MPATISFGDRVAVRDAPELEALGISGREGVVYGETTPSVTGVEVIGDRSMDYAINVHFEELDQSFWLSEDLLSLIDHGAGMVITLDGVPKQWSRTEDGEWVESGRDPSSDSRPWWKFWG